MKAEQEGKNVSEPKKDINKKIDIIFKAVIAGMIAIFLLQYPDIIYHIPSEVIITVISGTAMALSINAVLFCFIKPRTWLYRVISGAVSLFVGISLYREMRRVWDLNHPVFFREILQTVSEELFPFVYRLVLAVVSLICAAMIFGLALLVQYFYKRIKKKMASTP